MIETNRMKITMMITLEKNSIMLFMKLNISLKSVLSDCIKGRL
jgi:hypothetical protein